MTDNHEITFDPTDRQLETIGNLDKGDVSIDDLCNPAVVRLLIDQQSANLYEIKALKQESTILRNKFDSLRNAKEELRVRYAESKSDPGVEISAIVTSFIGGFAINKLSADTSDGLGWFLLLLSLVILGLLKYEIIKSVLQPRRYKDDENV